MATIDAQYYKKKQWVFFYVAIIFFFCVVLWTVILFLYNSMLRGKIETLDADISQYEQSISDLEADPRIEASQKYNQHKSFFERSSYGSQVPLFVNHLKRLSLKYGIESKGFTYKDSTIDTQMSSKSDERGYAYEKVTRLLREYPNSDDALFEITPTWNYSGYDIINFTPVLKVKNKSVSESSTGSQDQNQSVSGSIDF